MANITEMKIIFYTGTGFKGFEAPEHPTGYKLVPEIYLQEYKQAYAEAKRNALPILNPEIIQQGSGLKIELNLLDYNPKTGIDYDWPGSFSIEKRSWINNNGIKHEGEESIILSIPNTVKPENSAHSFSEGSEYRFESKTKTAEETLREELESLRKENAMLREQLSK